MSGSNAAGHGPGPRWAIGFAAGGVLAGHGLTYALVHPDGHERAGVLATTGHAYLHLLEGPGVVLALASVLAAALLGLGRLGHAPDRRSLFRWLATVQVGGFVAMEIAERVGSGAPSATVGDAALLLVGVGVQLGLARIGAAVLDVVRRGGERIGATLARLAPALPRPAFALAAPLAAAPAPGPARGPSRVRGPPLARR